MDYRKESEKLMQALDLPLEDEKVNKLEETLSQLLPKEEAETINLAVTEVLDLDETKSPMSFNAIEDLIENYENDSDESTYTKETISEGFEAEDDSEQEEFEDEEFEESDDLEDDLEEEN